MDPKITYIKFSDHYQIRFSSEGSVKSTRNFDTKQEVDAYMDGVRDTRYIANGLIQSLPNDITQEKL